jgi:hypothetical protein
VFNSNTPYHFKQYIGFQYYAISNLNNLTFQLLKKVKKPITNYLKFKPTRNKFFKSPLRFWLNDFYLDNKVFDTKYSSTMIQCSKFSRLDHTNFIY